ncbi:MAG: TIGR04283 family arsenosugar biosynthesis glycosyltransferase [Desulfobacterales bacterium]|uniref:TIGR04283 family arsenosugar biosynthesis glycosyltransferase n=1 Tax=Candidatus Desulfatibia profunda TaxID=2841695 RepID=A0A8J6NTZ4_9BACT|nr:TIGR04283 family arsenosugar biosynthesis glycosyltransferase [Candidatus Desulfatibia profunda]MBL7180023.1 TIGR04283 family arsenosugar biosynthesis glycosyltransferase [Desulfobacterales bacterium]
MNRRLSVIIPVFNESGIINATLDHLCGLDFSGDLEIIVVDGNQVGNTIKVITRSGIKKIIGEKGRGAQMNAGAAAAGGNVLLFLHADTHLGHDALDQIFKVFDRNDVAGGAFDLGIRSGKKIFRLIAKTASLRSRLTKIPYGDQAIFLKKQLFDRIGGFKNIPIMEDVELLRRIKKEGLKIKFVPRKVWTASRRWEKEGIVYCTLRNWTLITLYLLGVSPEKLKKFYAS